MLLSVVMFTPYSVSMYMLLFFFLSSLSVMHRFSIINFIASTALVLFSIAFFFSDRYRIYMLQKIFHIFSTLHTTERLHLT
jgi:hypothetical protein